jgi:hypothetical protein
MVSLLRSFPKNGLLKKLKPTRKKAAISDILSILIPAIRIINIEMWIGFCRIVNYWFFCNEDNEKKATTV